METKKEISTGRKIIYSAILLFVFLLFIEALLSVYFYQKLGGERIASLEAMKIVKRTVLPGKYSLNVTNHNLVRPDSTEKVNHNIAEESVRSNVFVYEPWVEYRNKDFNGDHMKMSGPIRKTIPDTYIGSSSDTLTIYFFGGSTMFGFNVLDYETVPSQFVKMLGERHPGKRSVRVVNYGMPTYYSYQELMLLTDLIHKGHRPDIIVCMDGINDFWFATASYYRQSYFSYVFRQVFSRGLRSQGEFKFLDTADNMFKNRPYVPVAQFNNTILNNYIENMSNIRMMADMIGAKTYFFCQPSPFYNYPNQQTDPMCFKDTNTRFNKIYPMLKKKQNQLPQFTYLGDMLEKEQGYPFVDGLHYSPAFIRKIVSRIYEKLEPELIKEDTLPVATSRLTLNQAGKSRRPPL